MFRQSSGIGVMTRGGLIGALVMIVTMVAGTGVRAATVTVNTTADQFDSGNDCSLREAVAAINDGADGRGCSASGSYGSSDKVLVPQGVYEIARTGTENDNASANDIDMTVPMTIEGDTGDPADVQLRPAGGYTERALEHHGYEETVTLRNLTIEGFRKNAVWSFTQRTRYVIENCVFRNNRTTNTFSEGPALYNAEGPTTVRDSSFLRNSAADSHAGAIFTRRIRAEHATFAGNSAGSAASTSRDGGAIYITSSSGKRSTFDNVTLVRNSASGEGGGIYVHDGSTINVRNSILAHNRAGGSGNECALADTAAIDGTGAGYNLVFDDAGCGLADPTSITRERPRLAAPGRYDGNTPVLPPMAGSPVIDAGDCSNGDTNPGPSHVGPDQRGVKRPNSDCDIGAVERNWTPLTVDNTGDSRDANPGDDTCADSGGDCTLRAAIDEANAKAELAEIRVPAGVITLSRAGAGEQDNATGDLDIREPLVLRGRGPDASIVDGNELGGVLHVLGGSRSVSVHGLRITGGSEGGIYCSAEALNLVQTALVGNRNSSDGGALQTFGCSRIRILASTVRGNTADGDGGGIAIQGSRSFESVPDRLYIENTFILNNEAVSGGGLYQVRQLQADLERVTLAGNTATSGQRHQLFVEAYPGTSSRADLHGSIVAGQATGANCGTGGGGNPVIASRGHNIEDGTSCGFGGGDDQQNTGPDLAPLADVGGPVRMRVPDAGSPAVDAGQCYEANGRIMARRVFGGTRPQDAAATGSTLGDSSFACDIGAAERQQVRVTQGPNPPSSRSVGAGSTDVVMAQFRIHHEGGGSLLMHELTLRASGSGDDGADVNAARLYVDENSDGRLDSNDTLVNTQAYGQDNGTVVFDLSSVERIASGGSTDLLVVQDFASRLAVVQPAPGNDATLVASLPAGGLALLAVLGLPLRRRHWFALAALVFVLTACGGGGGSDGGGGSGKDAETFAVVVEDLRVSALAEGELDIRPMPVRGAEVTVAE